MPEKEPRVGFVLCHGVGPSTYSPCHQPVCVRARRETKRTV